MWVCLAVTGEAFDDADAELGENWWSSDFVWLVTVAWLFTQVNRDFLRGDTTACIFKAKSVLSLTFDVGIEEVRVGEFLVAIITVLLSEPVLVRCDFTCGSAVCFLLKAMDSSDEETNEVDEHFVFDVAFCLICPSDPCRRPDFNIADSARSATDSILVLVGFNTVLFPLSAGTLLLPIDASFPSTLHDATVLALLITLLTLLREQASGATPSTRPVLFRFATEICEGPPAGPLMVLLLREYFFFQWLEECGTYNCGGCE